MVGITFCQLCSFVSRPKKAEGASVRPKIRALIRSARSGAVTILKFHLYTQRCNLWAKTTFRKDKQVLLIFGNKASSQY